MTSFSQPDASSREALLAALEFLVAAGIDVALDEHPHDRFAEDDRPRPGQEPIRATADPSVGVGPSPVVAESTPAPTLPKAALRAPDVIAAEARATAAAARSLDELETLVAAFDGCALKASAKQLAFADGVAGARVMILGEAPGAEEDRAGKPFIGREGQLLDRMLASIGLTRDEVYLAHLVPWRPPGNRPPTPQEIAICLPFALRQIELARPEFLVTLGSPGSQAVLDSREGISRLRGRWAEQAVGAIRLRVLPMLAPDFLMRHPTQKRLAWRDLLTLRSALDAQGSAGTAPDR